MATSFTYSTTTVSTARNPSFGSQWHKERLNQNTAITADAGRVVYDNGPNILKGVIEFLAVTKAEGDAIRGFIENTVSFGKLGFTITPPANTDLGAGVGTALTSCYYDEGATTEGVFEFIPPSKYNIRFKYWKSL